MKYELNTTEHIPHVSALRAISSLKPLLAGEKKILLYAILATLVNTAIILSAPLIIAHVLDAYILKLQFNGVLTYAGILFALYAVGLVMSYLQTRLMGGVGQRILFSVRETIFAKLQELPVAFFNVNKTGDLISRINNDTDKLNQFFSQTLVQLVGSLVSMVGAGIFILFINVKLGVAALIPVFVVSIFTYFVSPWIKRTNREALKATGELTAEVSESLENFEIVVAFNRRDFFRDRFAVANEANYTSAVKANIASNTLMPVFSFSANTAQLIVLAYGIYLIVQGSFTIGLLVSFLSYINNLYSPLRQIANQWSNFQVALAGWDRISAILQMENNMPILPFDSKNVTSLKDDNEMVRFENVSFCYIPGEEVLHKENFSLKRGKTYALVGPTGGGKSTTAALMARLYDPTSGTVFLQGRNLQTYTQAERAQKIGFILQEPILFSGTIRDNILYGNEKYKKCTNKELQTLIENAGLTKLLQRFEGGLESIVATTGDSLSLGQKQLIVFVRTVLREPEILILDEATANIDTVTEQLLETILEKLPPTTTRVIIAHRLNTIEHADEIFFISSGTITKAGSMQQAVAMLEQVKQTS